MAIFISYPVSTQHTHISTMAEGLMFKPTTNVSVEKLKKKIKDLLFFET